MERRVEIEVVGCVNGAPVEVVGEGRVGPDGAWLELRAVRASLGWDHALLVQPLADLLALAPTPDPNVPVAARARVDIYDDDGREVGELALTARVSREGAAVRLRCQITRGACRMEPGEEVVAVYEARQGEALPCGPERVAVTSAWSWRTGRGRSCWAVGTVVGEGAVDLRAAGELGVDVERSGTMVLGVLRAPATES